jgi:transcriptional regulator with XRE-family HTH domain
MADDDEIERLLAQRLRSLRQSHRLKLNTLAERTGISAAHLSRLENGDRQPSIGSLLQLARCYGLSLSQLVGDSAEAPYRLTRADEGDVRHTEDAAYRVLSGPGAQVGIVEVLIDPGQQTSSAIHDGTEWIHLTKGSIELVLGDETIVLKARDSIQFDASQSHRISCRGKTSARFILASSSGGLNPH